jgi:hypothetical protein
VTEARYQAKFLKRARLEGWVAWKIQAPGTNGVPDTLLLVPTAKGHGRAVFVELKAAGEEPTDLQEYYLNLLRRCGFVAFWADTTADIEDLIKYIRAQLRKRKR